MMQHASQAVRAGYRKVSNGLVHNSGLNGPGSTSSQTRSIHLSGQIRGVSSTVNPPTFTLQSVRPRNPPNKLFSASKNFLQRFFTYLTTPGFRVPVHSPLYADIGARSLHLGLRNPTIQNGLSFASRQALKNSTLQRQATMYLPGGPPHVRPPFGGVAQVGLGSARNFTTSRPIFQNLAQNVPIAARALYQADCETELLKKKQHMHRLTRKSATKSKKSKKVLEPKTSHIRNPSVAQEANVASNDEIFTPFSEQDMDRYFPHVHNASVTTYLLIPLAPTPSHRLPLDPDPGVTSRDSYLLPPLAHLGALHNDHSNHSLKVSTVFTRLDQANVWEAGGVRCSAYSQGSSHHRRSSEKDGSLVDDEGVCTILKIEFEGWTKAEVRGVIGESGSGWCVLEEVYHQQEFPEIFDTPDAVSPTSSTLSSPRAWNDTLSATNANDDALVDPASSLILPTLDLSTLGDASASIPAEMEMDPWNDAFSDLSSSSSYLFDLVVDPPSINGWFQVGRRSSSLGRGVDDEVQLPREDFF
ncbi:hypothetical protein D9613_003109 [Agrocybe pediades]|uniref:Uncharacterized protein n=1 Tax=Agrocybe pediades TaxID=84607 RepID=A0A8H4QNT4_9AGAR|nr:hypothetical protein D9613_003109 [Agrocybe pediades]